jgi:alpha-glucoside transport system substrate-binding protein
MRLSLKSLVWYNPAGLRGQRLRGPRDLGRDDGSLSDQMVADGIAPWCIGIESGDATGWVATDWVEDILLRTIGPDAYDQWVAGELAFSSDEVQRRDRGVHGPDLDQRRLRLRWSEQIAREAFGTSVTGILGDEGGVRAAPPGDLHRGLHRWSPRPTPSSAPTTTSSTCRPSTRSIGNARPWVVATSPRCTPTTARPPGFIEFLTNARVRRAVGRAWWLPVAVRPGLRRLDLPDRLRGFASEILAEADFFRFDGSDLMPGETTCSGSSSSRRCRSRSGWRSPCSPTSSAKWEKIAKSLIFLPMAISFVGASTIWGFIYAWRAQGQPQIGCSTRSGPARGEPVAWLQNFAASTTSR